MIYCHMLLNSWSGWQLKTSRITKPCLWENMELKLFRELVSFPRILIREDQAVNLLFQNIKVYSSLHRVDIPPSASGIVAVHSRFPLASDHAGRSDCCGRHRNHHFARRWRRSRYTTRSEQIHFLTLITLAWAFAYKTGYCCFTKNIDNTIYLHLCQSPMFDSKSY